jgi:dTDP-4-amino-4,6-dideoxygalactose transaminase
MTACWATCRLRLPAPAADVRSAWHLYVVRVDAGRHRAVFDALRADGIGVNLHYIPVHTQPYYRAMGFAPGQFPAAERYYAEAISIPLYAGLSEADQDQVVAALARALA